MQDNNWELTFRCNLAVILSDCGIGQAELMRRSGLASHTVSNAMSGLSERIVRGTSEKIIKAIDIEFDRLWEIKVGAQSIALNKDRLRSSQQLVFVCNLDTLISDISRAELARQTKLHPRTLQRLSGSHRMDSIERSTTERLLKHFQVKFTDLWTIDIMDNDLTTK